MKRKQVPRTYSMMDELMASSTEPMPHKIMQHQLISMYTSLRQLETAAEPSKHDWRVASDCVNLFETLVTMGVVEDSSKLLADAVKALGEAGTRSLKSGTIRLDGLGIQAVRAVLEDYSGILAQVTYRTMVRCHRLTEKRITEILSGNKQKHDVTVCAL
jgi:hypothetical protein